MARDVPDAVYGDYAKIADGGICPHCGKRGAHVFKTIELAHAFQFGDRYTRALDMIYLDENGERKHPLMASCGVGLGRLAAAILEVHHDEGGPIWPKSVAPWQVHICAFWSKHWDDTAIRKEADGIYEALLQRGVEALYDDRKLYAGGMLADADVFGAPLRVIVSPRHLKNGEIELISRDRSFSETVPVERAVDRIMELIS